MITNKIKICIVEDYTLTRTALKYSLSEYDDIDIVKDFDNAEECIKYLERSKVDVILMDLGLPYMNGLEATNIIKKSYPDTKIIIITSHDSEDEILTALSAGANAYLIKDTNTPEIYNIIHSVINGAIWLDPRIVKLAMEIFRIQKQYNNEKEDLGNLTEREKEVLKLLSEGCSNTEIAKKLIISSHTAKVHVSNILSKLAVTDRVQAAVKAYKYNLC